MTTKTATTQVRPRVDGDREGEIFKVVVRLLTELGYDKLTFDAVATEARASKATLYRRWNDKAQLVVDAVAFTLRRTAPADTGSLRGDLLAGACAEGGLTHDLPAVIGGIIPALHRDPGLFAAFQERFLGPKIQAAESTFDRAMARGEIASDADCAQLASVLPALCTYETFVQGVTLTPGRVAELVDRVVLPACRATFTDG